MTELELLMKDWTDEEKLSVYNKVERIESLKKEEDLSTYVDNIDTYNLDIIDSALVESCK